jgi:hypothetical protein
MVRPAAVNHPRRGLPAAARTRMVGSGPLLGVELEVIETTYLSTSRKAVSENAAFSAITGHSSKWPQILEYSAFPLVNR